MITPDDIRRKADNLYPAFVAAWLSDDTFFPRAIPSRRQTAENLSEAAKQVRALRAGSKEVTGSGYSVEWECVNSRRYGRNQFPSRIVFDTQEDFLEFIERTREFEAFREATLYIRQRYPELENWIRSHPALLGENAGRVKQVCAVVDCLRANPRPGVFVRELPVPVDTKFVEDNERILRSWLDILLPPAAIDSSEEHFARRYGLAWVDSELTLRFLDAATQRDIGSPWPHVSLPLQTWSMTGPRATKAVIVENRTNLFTLPSIRNAVALGGWGNAAGEFRRLTWLGDMDITYWGDIDVEGLSILSRIRSIFPHARSILMDGDSARLWGRAIGVVGSGRELSEPSNLTKAEMDAWRFCSENNLRIEQERIPQVAVCAALSAAGLVLAT